LLVEGNKLKDYEMRMRRQASDKIFEEEGERK
jgi:hypothetical protein